MTKRPPLSDPAEYEFMWVPRDGVGKESAIVRGSGAKTEQELYAALVEQVFEARGAEAVAELLAEHLRLPDPHPDVIATVARSLDPQTDDYIKLVVVGRRGGKRMTKRVNDAAITKAVKKNMESRGNKHGNQKKAVRDVARAFGVSKATVLKAIRSK
jgi:hypothetical protein